MHVPPEIEPPPQSTDLEGWRRAVNEQRYLDFRLEDVVAAIQDLGPTSDKDVLNPLAKYLSDSLLRLLRSRVGFRHRNRGLDIIEGTHGRIFEAILQPATADGRALRIAFVSRVIFRIKSVLAAEARTMRAFDSQDVEPRAARTLQSPIDGRTNSCANHDNSKFVDEKLDVESFLDQLPDDRQRLAFRLFMNSLPFTSKKSASITSILGICETTARNCVKTARIRLSSIPAVQELLTADREDKE